jgi:hypothetical protein
MQTKKHAPTIICGVWVKAFRNRVRSIVKVIQQSAQHLKNCQKQSAALTVDLSCVGAVLTVP